VGVLVGVRVGRLGMILTLTLPTMLQLVFPTGCGSSKRLFIVHLGRVKGRDGSEHALHAQRSAEARGRSGSPGAA